MKASFIDTAPVFTPAKLEVVFEQYEELQAVEFILQEYMNSRMDTEPFIRDLHRTIKGMRLDKDGDPAA